MKRLLKSILAAAMLTRLPCVGFSQEESNQAGARDKSFDDMVAETTRAINQECNGVRLGNATSFLGDVSITGEQSASPRNTTNAPNDNKREEIPAETAKTQEGTEMGQKAPNFTLKALDGGNVTLSEFKGNVVLLDFWASWCGPCQSTTPEVIKLHETYSRKGLVVLAMNIWDKPKDGSAYVTKHKLPYRVFGGEQMESVAKTYGIFAVPTFFLIDREGNIALGGREETTRVGSARFLEGEIERKIKEILSNQ